MMNLWAFLLLGFLAHTSHGCVQISFLTVETLTTAIIRTTLTQLKGSPVPVTAIDHGKKKHVQIKNAIIKDLTVSSIDAKCDNEGKVSVTAKGLVIVSSDTLSDATFDYEVEGQKAPGVTNGHFFWILVPGTFLLTTNLTNSLTCNDCSLTKEEVEKPFSKECQLFIKGLFVGAITTILTIVNAQYAKLTEKFKLHDDNCQYALNRLEMCNKSYVSYIIASCDTLGPLNDNSSLALNTVKPGEVSVYIEDTIFNGLLVAATTTYKTAIKKADTNGAFPSASDDLSLSITRKSLPKASITIEGAKAQFSFTASIQDSSENELITIDFDVVSPMYGKISSGIFKPSLGEANISQLSAKDPEKADQIKDIEPLVQRHTRLFFKQISCGLGALNLPDPMGAKINNAECITQKEKMYCVQKASEP